MDSNESLSLKQISQKLAVLMALEKASRTSELRALEGLQAKRGGVQIGFHY